MHSQKGGAPKPANTSTTRTPAGSSRASATTSSAAVVHLPPFCFECLDMDAEFAAIGGDAPETTTQFYLTSCGRMLCARCSTKEGMTTTDAPVIQCTVHQGRSERCVPINARMPANLRALFRLDYEAQCQDLCKRWDFVSRLHAHLVDGLLLANNGAGAAAGTTGLLCHSEAELQAEETELRADQAEEKRLRHGRREELIKLRTETQMAETKLADYMRMYTAQRAAASAATSVAYSNCGSSQPRWQRKDSSSTANASSAAPQQPPSGGTAMKTPAPAAAARQAAHPYKRSAKSPHQPSGGGGGGGGGHRRVSAFTGDSGVASASSGRMHLHTSTPLQAMPSASESSVGYSNFRSDLKTKHVTAVGRPTVLKSILKNSSAGGSSTRSGGSRATTTGQSSVLSSAGRFIVYEQQQQQQQQQQQRQSVMAGTSHEPRSRNTPHPRLITQQQQQQHQQQMHKLNAK